MLALKNFEVQSATLKGTLALCFSRVFPLFHCMARIAQPSNRSLWAGSASNTENAGGDIYGKQAGLVMAIVFVCMYNILNLNLVPWKWPSLGLLLGTVEAG